MLSRMARGVEPPGGSVPDGRRNVRLLWCRSDLDVAGPALGQRPRTSSHSTPGPRRSGGSPGHEPSITTAGSGMGVKSAAAEPHPVHQSRSARILVVSDTRSPARRIVFACVASTSASCPTEPGKIPDSVERRPARLRRPRQLARAPRLTRRRVHQPRGVRGDDVDARPRQQHGVWARRRRSRSGPLAQ